MSLRLVLADDERLARERLRRLLAAVPGCTVVAEAANGPDALAAIASTRPDAAFLDIEMPHLDGLGVLSRLPRTARPAIVLVTAHPHHAVRAFDEHATDYLLKPVPPERLADAVGRCRACLQAREDAPVGPSAKRLVVRGSDSIAVIETDEIDWIGSADNYVVIHVGRTTHVLRETLAAVESRLAPDRFIRISRSALINLRCLRQIAVEDSGHVAVLPDGTRLPITRGVRDVLARLEAS